MPKWIAKETFDCAPRRGKRFTLLVQIGEPTVEPAKGTLSAYGRCLVSLEPLAPERRVGGENRFQALCLTFDYIRTVLKVFVAEGGGVYFRRTKNPIDLDSPWFCPLPSLNDL